MCGRVCVRACYLIKARSDRTRRCTSPDANFFVNVCVPTDAAGTPATRTTPLLYGPLDTRSAVTAEAFATPQDPSDAVVPDDLVRFTVQVPCNPATPAGGRREHVGGVGGVSTWVGWVA